MSDSPAAAAPVIANATVAQRSARTNANFAELSTRIDCELSTAMSVKSSFESRTFGLFALNLGVVTLYLALREPLGVVTPGSDTQYFWVLCVAFATAALSLVIGLWAAWPSWYQYLPVELLDSAYKNAQAADTILLPDLIPERLTALESLRRVNNFKAILNIISLALALVSIIAFVASIVGPLFT